MERGFDKLNNPLGLTLVMVAAVLVLGIIVVGAVLTRSMEAEGRRRRAEARRQAEAGAATPPTDRNGQ